MKKGLFALIIVGIMIFSVGCSKSGNEMTHIDRPEDVLVDYAANLSIVRGHLRSSLAGLTDGDYPVAELHTGHPQEEGNVAAVIDELKVHDKGMAEEVNDTFGDLSDKAAEGDSAAVEEATALLDEALTVVVPASKSDNLNFQSKVLIKMLLSVKDQYADGVLGGSMTEESEYGDAYGIYKEIRALYKDLSKKVPEPQNQKIEDLFSQTDKAFPAVSLPGDIEPMKAADLGVKIDAVIAELKKAAGIS